MKRFPSALLVIVLLASIGAACSGDQGSSPVRSGGDGVPEQAEITVGVLPIADVAPVYLAIERGLFANEGLSVTVELVQGGAAAIPALQGGDLDLTYGNWVSFLLANQEGIELRAVAGGVAAAPGFTELLTLPSSGLEGNPGRLTGATIAVNTMSNIGELAIRSTLRAHDVELGDVQLVEVPFPDMGAALERGDVDVIWASEPVPTTVKRDLGAVTVIDSFVGEMETFPVAGYQATAGFVAEHPRTVAAFRRALEAAVAAIETDDEALRATIVRYSNLPADVVADLSLPSYESAIEPSTLERVRDYLVEFEMLEDGLDVELLVAGGT